MKTLAIASIKFYQKFLTKLVVSNCRFEPSCSNYSIDAITRYGIIKGSFLGLKRILRCNPMFVGGIDPVK